MIGSWLFGCIIISACELFESLNCYDSKYFDTDHLYHEHQCGRLPSLPKSRISNAKETDTHYPWVVEVIRSNQYLQCKEYRCGGSIITQNSVVSAAHCICGRYDDDAKSPTDFLKKIKCRGGLGNAKEDGRVVNEITDDNMIKIGAGHIDKRHLKLFDVVNAFVYDEYEEEYKQTDLSLLQTTYLKPFYLKSQIFKRGFDIGPICLAAENTRLTDSKIEIVGWGKRYGEFKKEDENVKDRELV